MRSSSRGVVSASGSGSRFRIAAIVETLVSPRKALSSDHLVQHGAETENVRARIELQSLRLLRRKVRDRAEDGPLSSLSPERLRWRLLVDSRLLCQLRETEIQDLDQSGFGNHNIARF